MALATGKYGIRLLTILFGIGGHQSVPVRIDSVVLSDERGHIQRIRPASSLSLPACQNHVILTLRAITPTPIQYRLEGLDEHWLNGFSTDRIHYANLPGGTYKFRVQTSNSLTESQLLIAIEAPFWKQWWFVPVLILYVLGVVGVLGYLLLQYRFRQKLRILQTRDRIARDLHDDMGSYLTSISVLSEIVLNVTAKDPQQAGLLVNRIGATARHALNTMSDIVWAINPENDSMAQLVRRIHDVASDLLGEDIALHSDLDLALQRIHLPLEQRRDFYLIIKEALHNIAKYAQAQQVWLRFKQSGKVLTLTIQDDGVGFDSSQPSRQNLMGGNGLKNMHSRANKLGGTLTVASQPGQGTTLTLVVNE